MRLLKYVPRSRPAGQQKKEDLFPGMQKPAMNAALRGSASYKYIPFVATFLRFPDYGKLGPYPPL